MRELAILIGVVAAAILAYRQAKATGEGSWPGLLWTLLLVAVYAGLTVAAGFARDSLGGAAAPATRTGLILLPIALGVVPTAAIAKQIQRRFRQRRR